MSTQKFYLNENSGEKTFTIIDLSFQDPFGALKFINPKMEREPR